MNIILVFPKIENGKRIKNILLQNGFNVSAVCTAGAKALQHIDNLSDGIVVCSYRCLDMVYFELYEYLPSGFEMLLLASEEHCSSREYSEIVCLHLPLRIHELIQTLHMMADEISRRKKRFGQKKGRTQEEEEMICAAKALLMEKNHMTEEEAHRYLQKRSMDNGASLAETAQMVICLRKG